MDDKELLELAAKAADILYIKPTDCYDGAFGLVLTDLLGRHLDTWNPLKDDGDALRLAVRLGLAVRVLEKCIFVESDPETLLGQSSVSELEMYGNNDPYAATRRAIVRAAAEIGKGMQ